MTSFDVSILYKPQAHKYYLHPTTGLRFLVKYTPIKESMVIILSNEGKCVTGFAFFPDETVVTLDTGERLSYAAYRDQGLAFLVDTSKPSATAATLLVNPTHRDLSAYLADLLVATSPSAVCTKLTRGGASKQYTPDYLRLLQGDHDVLVAATLSSSEPTD